MAGDYERVEGAIRFLTGQGPPRPTPAEVAAHLGLSEPHFRRLFRRWAGVSPKRFLESLSVAEAKRILGESRDLLRASFEAGLSGPGRLHDLFVNVEAVTPGEYRRLGLGLSVRFGVHVTPFGDALFAATDRGLCSLEFLDGDGPAARARLRDEWPLADLSEDRDATARLAEQIFAPMPDSEPPRLLLKGTNFQIQVWRALLRIPPGRLATYADVADWVGRPNACRAVGNAVGANPVSYLIPCHRVIRETAVVGGYRWGTARKLAMIAREAATMTPDREPEERRGRVPVADRPLGARRGRGTVR